MASHDIQEGKIAADNQQLTRERAGEISSMEVFYSYSHEDEALRDKLEKHLSILKRQGYITTWHDRRIVAGQEWADEIDTHLNTAQIILLLVSSDFMDSDYCYSIEVKRAVDRHKRGEARVIPVILRPVLWREATFGKLQALPKNAKPITSWPDQEEAFFDVAQGIREAVEELMTRLEAGPEGKQRQEIVPTKARVQTLIQDYSPRQAAEPALMKWKVEAFTLTHTLTSHIAWLGAVNAVAISPDGQFIVSGESEMGVWDPHSGTLLRTLTSHTLRNLLRELTSEIINFNPAVYAVAISPDGRFIVSGADDKTVRVWDLHSGTLLRTLTGHSDDVYAVAISPDGQFIVSGGGDKTVRVWDLHSGTLLRTLTGHSVAVRGVAISPDGQFIVSGSGEVRVWDLHSGTLLRTLNTGWVSAVAISPDGQFIVSGDSDKTVRVWDLHSGTLLRTLTGHTGWLDSDVRAVAISPDGQFIVSGGSDKTVRVWDLHSGTLLRTLTGHTRTVRAVAISPDSQFIVSGSEDGKMMVYRTR